MPSGGGIHPINMSAPVVGRRIIRPSCGSRLRCNCAAHGRPAGLQTRPATWCRVSGRLLGERGWTCFRVHGRSRAS